MFIITV